MKSHFETKKKWYEANLIAARESQAKWYEANQQSLKSTAAPWYEANLHLDPHADTKKKWYQANLEAARASRNVKPWYNDEMKSHFDTKKKLLEN